MTTIIVHHQVKNYEEWRQVFDKVADMRKGSGETRATIFQGIEDGNAVTGIFEWKDVESARAYFSNPQLKAAMAEAGVVGAPDVHFLTS